MILIWGKPRSHRASILGYRGAESPGWFNISPQISAQDVMYEQALAWWSWQSLVSHSCGLLTHPNSFRGRMFKLHTKFDVDCSTRSVILNAMATQYTCSLNGSYHPHRLVQWSHHCSYMCVPVHSPWLPGYTDVQTVLVILTMAGLFLDRSHITCPDVYENRFTSYFLTACTTPKRAAYLGMLDCF